MLTEEYVSFATEFLGTWWSNGDPPVKIEFRQQGHIKGLDKQIDKAVRMAQKDAIRKLKSATAKYVSAQYWLTQSTVKQHISDYPKGIKVSSKRLGLEKYKLTPSKPHSGKRLKAAVRRSGGMKKLSSFFFLWEHIRGLPFERVDGTRYPVERVVGPAIPQLVDNRGVIEHIQREASETFSKRFKHYISRIGRAT